MARFDPLAFVARHGVVLASAKGPVPSVGEEIAGEPIRGSWWAHPKGHAIFNALGVLGDSPDVLAFRWIGGKITFVHRRLPADSDHGNRVLERPLKPGVLEKPHLLTPCVQFLPW